MTNNTLYFSLTGDENVITNGIRTFALATGWTEKVTQEGVEIDNPVTYQDHASEKLYSFISDVVKSYNANLGADAGRKSTLEETEAAYTGITHQISIES